MVNSMKLIGVVAAVGAGLGCLALAGCASAPTGPTVAVWPSPGKPFSVFQAEDAACRQYAAGAINPNAANNTAVKRAALGTALGAAAGLLIGDSARGVGIGAGAGLLVGSASGSNASESGNWTAQRQYNIAYEQCMYSKGNQIPGAPQPAYTPPPPPPGG
ncbi:MAG: YMGG-like glycine zipper-containing protein [Gammaproteobacteria bacterium]